jgi:threonine dehydrogenase-like Zn-dependent dehydrogenase
MKAYAMLGASQTGWIEKEVPHCGPMDAICRPLALAPCTSDVHTVWENAVEPRINTVLGHEAVGEIVEVGELVQDFKVSDKVIIPAITPDWNSIAAQGGFSMHSGGMLGGAKFTNLKDGVFAEFFHVNDADGNLALLPEGMDFGAALMLTDMIPTGFHACELAQIEYGDTVCVIGIGPVGLMAVRGAVLKGASRIFAVGTRQNCIDVAKSYGATDIISYKNGPLGEQILALTGGQGVDKVIIAGGTVDTFNDAVQMLKPGGVIGNVNYLSAGDFVKIPRNAWGLGMGHKTIAGGLMLGGRLRMEKLASMVTAGRINPSPLITHTFHGFDKIEDSLFLMRDKPADVIKPIVII